MQVSHIDSSWKLANENISVLIIQSLRLHVSLLESLMEQNYVYNMNCFFNYGLQVFLFFLLELFFLRWIITLLCQVVMILKRNYKWLVIQIEELRNWNGTHQWLFFSFPSMKGDFAATFHGKFKFSRHSSVINT